MVIGAVLGCSYKLVPEIPIILNSGSDVSQEDYQKQHDMYERNMSQLMQYMEMTKIEMQFYEDYIDNSVLFKISFMDKPEVVLTVFIGTGELENEWNPDTLNPVSLYTNVYANLIEANAAGYIAAHLDNDLSVQYVRELVSYKVSGNIITVTVTHHDESISEEMMDSLESFILGLKPSVIEVAGVHELNKITRFSRNVIDLPLRDNQTSTRNHLITLNNNLEDTTKRISDLNPPASVISSKREILSSAIKYAVLGAVGGLLISFALVFLFDVSSTRITSSYDAKRVFSIKVLGNLDLRK